MSIINSDEIKVRSSEDIVEVRRAVKAWAEEMGFSHLDQTKIVTASSELARNMLVFAGGGKVRIEHLRSQNRKGLRVHFIDEGPGIEDIDMAMQEGFSTGDGLGLGLSGASKLVNEFTIDTEVGKGTRVTITRWE